MSLPAEIRGRVFSSRFEIFIRDGVAWLARIRGPRKLRLPIVALVKKIERYLIHKGIVQGEYVFIEATK